MNKNILIAVLKPGLMAILFILASCGHARNTENNQEARVQIITEFGNITIKLFNETPLHRDNFLKLAGEGFYDGLLFHRVISGFMIQAGDPLSRDAQPGQPLGMGDPGYTLPAEIVPGIFHRKGALAAARQGDQINPERRSSGSQFYIVQGRLWTNEELDMMEQRRGIPFSAEERVVYATEGGTPHLDHAYTVFGQVIEGLEVIDRIAAVPTGQGNRPLQNVVMRIVILN
ncbi:MAG TPA: peptidylprolyl isomerase [Bacteroidales bacterium]|nr:peptidylprolyl isomerase [Bacteroidales bacterium]